MVFLLLPVSSSGQDARADFFETRIRPLLANHCVRCHGPEKQSGGLRLDQLAELRQGGDGGPVLVPGKPDESRLLRAVRHDDDELQMPPDEKLSDQQIQWLTEWITADAFWPEASEPIRASRFAAATEHWAFQPIRVAAVPDTAESDPGMTPVDAFVRHRLRAEGLAASPESDRRTLIRRVCYAITGLPPAPEDVAEFVMDPDPMAYDHLVDRLLSSVAYGEHWARRWLDIARYSDTKGYVYAREERFWIHAWNYRDWVVAALNRDLPYDQFLLLQIAADQVPDRDPTDLAAMGFLTIGRRFLGVQRDIIDDRIDVLTRGTMSLTVGCARCHDHKYDPIPAADYYSLYGVFASCREQLIPIPSDRSASEEFLQGLSERQSKLNDALRNHRATTAARVRSRIGDYLSAQTELQKYPEEGFDQIFGPEDILPSFVRRWETFLRAADRRKDPVFIPWHRYAGLGRDQFRSEAAAETVSLQRSAPGSVNPVVLAAFAEAPVAFSDVTERYAALFHETERQWQGAVSQSQLSGGSPPTGLPDAASEQIRQVMYGPESPCEVPDEPVVHTELDFESAVCTELWKLQGEVDRWILAAPHEPGYALTLTDRPTPLQPRIFQRGNPATKGDEVPRQFLSLFRNVNPKSPHGPFQRGSGRLELAEAIIDPANPLTARVIVNRVWAHHFGAGLVATTGDFGTRSTPPSHPALLDWLAADFVSHGWSLKHLHRQLLLSRTFRQCSMVTQDPGDSVPPDRARTIDPANRLLWRMNAHRLSFEEMRDSMLAVCGNLDARVGGLPADLFTAPYPLRRTLYGLIDRQFLPGTLRMFDFANPDLHIPQRSETTVPQQALFLLNHPLILERARALARSVAHISDPAAAARRLFQIAWQREPDEDQLADSVRLITAEDGSFRQPVPTRSAAWSWGWGHFDESTQRVDQFHELPHFTGTAWQGGSEWPDPALGWVQLTGDGGHPGNDRLHAAVRRWTAPASMTVTIQSRLIHAAEPGDGVRAFTVSSHSGLLNSATVHNQSASPGVATLTVREGETIDFLVDIGTVLDSDQFSWVCKLQVPATGQIWNSADDFSGHTSPPLTPLEQLAHVLLCSNEFLFVD